MLPDIPRKPEPLHKGLDAVVHGWMGRWRRRRSVSRRLEEEARQAEALHGRFKDLGNAALRQQLQELKAAVRRRPDGGGEEFLAALAAVREAAGRTLGLQPFLVQLSGALALARGFLAEMATGEGKTLTAGLAAVVLAWRGRPCHVVTVNDYLVERDANGLRPLYEFCGVRVGHVAGGMEPPQRREAYAADVTYGTSKELAADFLRDQIQLGTLRNPDRRLLRGLLRPRREGLVMRGLHAAIIDEADSLLIDEAVTPLIISARSPNEELRDAVLAAHGLAEHFEAGRDYLANPRYRDIDFTSSGERLISEKAPELSGIWKMRERSAELVRQALVAREFYREGHQFTVQERKVVIVDEFTGRPMPDRSWRMGLHQAVEAKEGLPVTDPTETVARISFQNFFRQYRRLSGMTGTAREAADEFWRVYGLPVVRIPTNRPCIRRQLPFRLFQTEAEKLAAIVARVRELHAGSRPVLVGTRTVRASESIARLLQAEGIHPQVLNANRIREEAQIVSLAGQPGRVTIATNMAGRGTDIRLGDGVSSLGGLHVLASERHESGRVDRQLFGRCARQGDPGTAEAFASLEDELLQKFSLPVLRKVAALAPVAGRAVVALAQRLAQRQAFRQRKRVLEADTWLEQSLSFAEK